MRHSLLTGLALWFAITTAATLAGPQPRADSGQVQPSRQRLLLVAVNPGFEEWVEDLLRGTGILVERAGILPERAEDWRQYDAIMLADPSRLDDADLTALENYVSRGGGVITNMYSVHDQRLFELPIFGNPRKSWMGITGFDRQSFATRMEVAVQIPKELLGYKLQRSGAVTLRTDGDISGVSVGHERGGEIVVKMMGAFGAGIRRPDSGFAYRYTRGKGRFFFIVGYFASDSEFPELADIWRAGTKWVVNRPK